MWQSVAADEALTEPAAAAPAAKATSRTPPKRVVVAAASKSPPPSKGKRQKASLTDIASWSTTMAKRCGYLRPTGEPLNLGYLSPGAQIIAVLRPAALLEHPEARKDSGRPRPRRAATESKSVETGDRSHISLRWTS